MIKKNIVFGFLLCWISVIASAQPAQLRRDSILKMMNKVAGWQITEFVHGHVKSSEIGWENGALYTGIIALKKINNSDIYDKFLYGIGEQHDWNLGPNRFFADDYCVAQMYTAMFIEHKDSKMITKWILLADSIVAHKFDEPLKVVPNINHREWAWCDALFMGPPGLALLTKATGNPAYFKKADSLWWKTSAYLYDPQEHLYYRDSRYFDKKEKNGEKVFWSRGNGWVMGGLVKMMENMPKGFKNRKMYEIQFKQMAKRIAELQQPDGSWHASLLDPVTFGEKETSGTGFYCYAITWGINHGLLSANKYMPIVSRAWDALLLSVHPDGKLGYVQNVGDKPVSASYDNTNVYGVGAFLLAGSELYKLNQKY